MASHYGSEKATMNYTKDKMQRLRGLDDYERLKLLGKGSFGKAWKVRHEGSGDVRVAKEIKCANQQDLDDALGEARVLSKLKHPFIVGYYDVIRSSAKLVTIVMQFCAGGDLGEKIARRKYRHQHFDESIIKMWFCQITDAVAYLHAKGILHRDIKSGNVFLGDHDIALLGDFGIARVLDRNAVAPSERTTRTPVGTPMNMSPEICRGERYGQKADIWALGCVLYEMVSLRPAFMAYDMESLVRKIKRGHHDKYIPRHYTLEVAKTIDSMLQVDAARRPTACSLLDLAYLSSTRAEMQGLKGGAAAVSISVVEDPKESLSTVPDVLVVKPTELPEDSAGSLSPVREETLDSRPLRRPSNISPGASPSRHASPRCSPRRASPSQSRLQARHASDEPRSSHRPPRARKLSLQPMEALRQDCQLVLPEISRRLSQQGHERSNSLELPTLQAGAPWSNPSSPSPRRSSIPRRPTSHSPKVAGRPKPRGSLLTPPKLPQLSQYVSPSHSRW
eukprot:m.24310 g.24310  ORF g.24310 m.24310 type:complete len:506 (-) comp11493_c0_seq1:93-1610(-)